MTKIHFLYDVLVGKNSFFKRESILITHRIVEVMEGGEYGIAFVTKGDNNSSADDEYVNPQDIKGIIKYVIPKIGWPTLLIKSTRDIPLDEIVF
jgi:signal peptidase